MFVFLLGWQGKERGMIGKSLESGWEVRDGVGGTYLLRYSTCKYAPMGLWLLMMLLLVVVLLMCMRLGDLRPIIASFDGRRPCYRNGLCWREYMYLGRKPYRILAFCRHLDSAYLQPSTRLCSVKRNQAASTLKLARGFVRYQYQSY